VAFKPHKTHANDSENVPTIPQQTERRFISTV
jgi:hypothetical protein